MRKKQTIKTLLLTIIFAQLLFFCPSTIFAETFEHENMEIHFEFPEDETLLLAGSDVNYASYTDESFSSVSIIVSDIYYEITENGDPDLEEWYPKDDVWIGCGLFEESWNLDSYVESYLSEAINDGTKQYTGTIENLTLDGLKFYKYSYMQEDGNAQSPGGVIYFTLYRSKLYTVSISNFYLYEESAKYGSIFEQTVLIDGIETFEFPVFEKRPTPLTPTTIALIAFGSVILLGSLSAILIIRRNKY